MPFNQHLSSQQTEGTFASKKCVWEKMEEGDSLTTEQKKRRPNNCWSVKVCKFSFPFSFSERKRKLSSPEIVKCYFSSPFFWGTRRPEKLWLQQFSNHPISKLRSFQMLWAIHTSWDSLQCAAWVRPRLRAAGWNCGKLFLQYAVTFSLLYQP